MIGANVIFHLVSLLVGLALVFFILRLRGQRQTLRHLLMPDRGKRFLVLEPAVFLAKLCAAVDVAFEAEGDDEGPQKIEINPWRELLTMSNVSLIRWRGGSSERLVTVFVRDRDNAAPIEDDKILASRLGASLGTATEVLLKPDLNSR